MSVPPWGEGCCHTMRDQHTQLVVLLLTLETVLECCDPGSQVNDNLIIVTAFLIETYSIFFGVNLFVVNNEIYQKIKTLQYLFLLLLDSK